jgi:hypothetical protein
MILMGRTRKRDKRQNGNDKNMSFIMPASGVTVKRMPSGFNSFFQIDTITHVTGPGNIIADFIQEAGKKVVLTVTTSTPDIRLKSESFRVIKDDITAAKVFLRGPFAGINEGDIEFSFTMPENNVTIHAEFES